MTNKITIKGYSLILLEDKVEPLIQDVELAKKLGFAQPRDIRKLIKRHETVITEEFGAMAIIATFPPKGQGGPAVDSFYLTEEQALFIVTKSETPLANRITAQIIKVYKTWRKDNVVTVPNQTIVDPVSGQQRKVTAYDPPVTRGEIAAVIAAMAPKIAKDFMDENGFEDQLEKFVVKKVKGVLKVVEAEVEEIKSTALNAEENITATRETLVELKSSKSRQRIALKRLESRVEALTEEVAQLRAAQEKTDQQVSVFKKQFTAVKEDLYNRLDVHRKRLNIHKKQIADFKETLGLNFEKVRRQFKGKKPN